MSDRPDVSVVMSVYNGAEHLRETLDSIMAQEGVSFELVVVDDGSTDQSAKILEEYASRDERVRVFQQENQGLTRSLIRGCSEARGKYIARQDAGDVSLTDRLVKQVNCFVANVDAALVSCGTRFMGPNREHLYDVSPEPSAATTRLLSLDLNEIRGPSHHGSALFSKELYNRVGGYRSSFYFAQDLDLWIRLVENGTHIILPEILYQSLVDVVSMSGLYRKEQIQTAKVILDCARRRRDGLSETPALERVGAIGPPAKRYSDRRARARSLYFIGVCLKERKNPKAPDYFKRALREYPLHVKSAARLLLG
jgi:glycosyltransferase involved in cell wall biosynthesis